MNVIGDTASLTLKITTDHSARLEHVQNCRKMVAKALKVTVKGDAANYVYLTYL